MKKTAIFTLLAALLAAAIMACGYAGTTNADSAATARAMDTPTVFYTKDAAWIEAPEETSEESAEAEPSTGTSAATAEEQTSEESSETAKTMPDTAQPNPLPVGTAVSAPIPENAVQSASPTPVATPVGIAPVVPTPVTAVQTTTTTRYVPPQTAAATTTSSTVLYTKGNYEWVGTTQAATTTTTHYIPPTTTATIRPPTTQPPTTTSTTQAPATQAGPDYEAMGQALYQDEAVKALNALRAERGLPPMTINPTLMANSLAQAQRMVAAGYEYHSTVDLPGCESVARVPYNFPAKLMGETLAKHVAQFLTDSRTSVGIAVVRQGNYLYAVMQGT